MESIIQNVRASIAAVCRVKIYLDVNTLLLLYNNVSILHHHKRNIGIA